MLNVVWGTGQGIHAALGETLQSMCQKRAGTKVGAVEGAVWLDERVCGAECGITGQKGR